MSAPELRASLNSYSNRTLQGKKDSREAEDTPHLATRPGDRIQVVDDVGLRIESLLYILLVRSNTSFSDSTVAGSIREA